MVIYLGADHRGFKAKELVKHVLADSGYEVSDLGAPAYDENDDFPAYARAVSEKVSVDYENARGILACGSGAGVAIVANKFPNVRAAVAISPNLAFDAKNDDDINVLCLPADYVDENTAKRIVLTWLQTPFSGEERFKRRIREISDVEVDIAREIQNDALEDVRKRRDMHLPDQ
jgi:ribose 5-phosphate isomerase B